MAFYLASVFWVGRRLDWGFTGGTGHWALGFGQRLVGSIGTIELERSVRLGRVFAQVVPIRDGWLRPRFTNRLSGLPKLEGVGLGVVWGEPKGGASVCLQSAVSFSCADATPNRARINIVLNGFYATAKLVVMKDEAR